MQIQQKHTTKHCDARMWSEKATQNRQGALDKGTSACVCALYALLVLSDCDRAWGCSEQQDYAASRCTLFKTQGTHSSSVPIAPLPSTFKLCVVV